MTRRALHPTYVVAFAIYAVLVVYASLLPWQLDHRREAFGSMAGSAWMQPSARLSITDVAANILLFVPLGFLATACQLTNIRRRWWIAAAITIASAAFLSAAIEVAQLFVPGRIFTPTDVVAETLGAIVGVLGWFAYGPELTALLQTLRRPSTRSRALALGMLAVYFVAFVGSQVLPLTLTADVAQLARKYRDGDIALIPFAASVPPARLLAYALAVAPVGALVAWLGGRQLRLFSVWALSIVALCVLELVQLPIIGQRTDTSDIIVGAAGALLGITVVRAFFLRPDSSPSATPHLIRRRLAWGTAALWVVAVAAVQWWPFGFQQEYQFVRERLLSVPLVPFENYYVASTSQAASQLVWKFCLGLPLGVLLTFAWPRSSGHMFERLRIGLLSLIGIVVFGAIELGQILLPGRYPDPSDVVIEIAGVATGMYAASALSKTILVLR